MALGGLKRLGRPVSFRFAGSAGATHNGRANKRWIAEDLGTDLNGFYLSRAAVVRVADDVIVSKGGVVQEWGTAAAPKDIRFITADQNQAWGWDFENNKEPSDGDFVDIIT